MHGILWLGRASPSERKGEEASLPLREGPLTALLEPLPARGRGNARGFDLVLLRRRSLARGAPLAGDLAVSAHEGLVTLSPPGLLDAGEVRVGRGGVHAVGGKGVSGRGVPADVATRERDGTALVDALQNEIAATRAEAGEGKEGEGKKDVLETGVSSVLGSIEAIDRSDRWGSKGSRRRERDGNLHRELWNGVFDHLGQHRVAAAAVGKGGLQTQVLVDLCRWERRQRGAREARRSAGLAKSEDRRHAFSLSLSLILSLSPSRSRRRWRRGCSR